MRVESEEGESTDRYPILKTFGCCAFALTPHVVSKTTIAKSPAHFRFWILRQSSGQVLDFRLSDKKSRHRTQDLLFILFALNRKSAIENRKLVLNECERILIHFITLSALASPVGGIVIITFMSLPRKIHTVEETVRAVYEKGVLRPLRPLRLKEQSRVLITLYPERQWRKEFERLLRRMKARTKGVPQELIETEVTRARAEAKAKRRAARRPA
jgi:predicted DNA-binding antitoxin AbrB/MazE fold protein